MAFAALTNVVDKVTKLLSSTDNFFISAAENELQELKSELSLLKAWFSDMSKRGKENEVFRNVERQIMEVAYNTEDAIDSFLAQAREFIRLSPRAFNRVSFLARDVRSLREDTVKPVFDKYARMLLGDRSGLGVDDRSETQRKFLPLIKQENIIGFELEEKTVIECLKETTEELDVISIIGMAGLGKTTLARKIYENYITCYEFPTRIWVHASEMFNRKNVFLKILTNFTSQDMSYLSDEDLAHRVYWGLQERHRFFLVIDDVCSVEDWDAIQHVLPNNCNGKVLITSRYTNVGRHANPTREPLCLGFLTKEQTLELLQYEVFGSLKDCPTELMEIGEYIAKQCEGLPLAIMHMGRIVLDILSSRKEMSESIDEWNTVSENLSFLKYEMEQEAALHIIASSYNTLPQHLRDCFLYLGVFPENFEIPIWTLINLWIAEGFIQRKPGMSLEEIAEENFMDLVNRNLVMVDKTNPMGKIKTCHVQAVIHAFCRSKASTADRNLFQEIKMSRRGILEPPISDVQKCYRVCVHPGLLESLSGKLTCKNLRSLLCFNKKPVNLDSDYISANAGAFCMLRVLAANSVKFREFPKGIAKLIHLSYITLCGNDLEIPEDISLLQNLQTIVLETESPSLTIKANIWRMVLLKHVKTKAAIILDIQGKEGAAGENLQTLSRLSPKSCTMDVFNRAPNLKKLGIRGQLATLDATCLKKMDRLENLKLKNDVMHSDAASRDHLHGLLHLVLNNFPVNLKMLTLSATYLDWEQLTTLGKIDTLQILKLINHAFTGELWTVHDDGFPYLEFLLIASTDLVSWYASTVSFPSLSCLVLKNCEKLKRLPTGLAKSLNRLEIENLPIAAVESARKIEKMANGLKLSIIDASDHQ